MSLYVQYHNVQKEGLQPLFAKAKRFAIYTQRPHVQDAQGTVYLIVGVGRPKRCFLWEAFKIETVEADSNGAFVGEGPGLATFAAPGTGRPGLQLLQEIVRERREFSADR